ncbi:MAG TPA: hypothetical protein VG672_22390 [Bryobacteraceae bacterium]|jgi:hypothetical protein|nr:hypothetical protein [Bryobacteraceae bacterium]
MPGKKKWDWSFRNGTTFGFHLTLNPQPPLPPSVRIYRQFLDHGIVIRDQELQSILKGREEGVRTIHSILNNTVPGLGPDLRLKLSGTLADALLDKSLRGQLSREMPTSLERIDQRDAVMQHIYNQVSPPRDTDAFLPHLLKSLPPVGVGFSLTIHF